MFPIVFEGSSFRNNDQSSKAFGKAKIDEVSENPVSRPVTFGNRKKSPLKFNGDFFEKFSKFCHMRLLEKKKKKKGPVSAPPISAPPIHNKTRAAKLGPD